MGEIGERLVTRKVIEQGFERRLLIGMIVSDRFLRDIKTIYRANLVSHKYVDLIAKWCFEYSERYDKAPGIHIEDFVKSDKVKEDEDLERFMGKLLDVLSDEYERSDKFNSEYLLDEAEKHFKARSISLYAEELKALASQGDIQNAEGLLAKFVPPSRIVGGGCEPFGNAEKIKTAFEYEQETLFKFSGALGEFINDQLVREGFIGIMAPEKRGKSFWLREFGIRGLRSRCNVAYFDTGDTSENRLICQLHSNIAERPLKRFSKDTPILVPVVDCKWNQDDECGRDERTSKVGLIRDGIMMQPEEAAEAGYKPCSGCKYLVGAVYYENRSFEPLTWQEAVEQGEKILNRAKGRRFKLSCHDNSTLTVKGIDSILETWKHFEDFVPDIVVVDYADIMAPDNPKEEIRHQENTRWKGLRRLAQKWHCLVVVGTQTDSASYNVDVITRSNFTEDKRKYSHVTAMYTLNQTDDERKVGILRFGELLVREGGSRSNLVTVLECRHIGKVHIGSFFSQ